MSTPEISVVVPTYRRASLLPRLVRALEAQTLDLDCFEVLVVDNASDDATPDVLRQLASSTRLRLQTLRLDVNRGPAAARNLGLRTAVAPFVAFTDDDCVPDPRWVESGLMLMAGDEHLGVAQGCTVKPAASTVTDWAVFREVVAPSPFFEGCNLFFRRDAAIAAGGFPEDIGWFGEDTALGWAVVDAGWARGFVEDAVVVHDVAERGVAWRIRFGYRERRNLMAVAARHASFRRDGFWRPWAFRREDALTTLAVAGLLLSSRWRAALLLALPYLRERRPPAGHARPLSFALERFAVDVAQAAGVAVGAARHRLAVV